MTAKIRELINNMRALREAATPSPTYVECPECLMHAETWNGGEVCKTCGSRSDRIGIVEKPAATSQARLERALEIAIEALLDLNNREVWCPVTHQEAMTNIEKALKGEP